MRGLWVMTAAAMLSPALANAHVTVRPRESKPGIVEHYTVRVPTEGQVSTASVEFDAPAGVEITDVAKVPGATHVETRDGARIARITWTKEVKTGEVAEFVFAARNPPTGAQIAWKVTQRFADGTHRSWAPATSLVQAADGGQAPHGGDAAAIEAWLSGYDAAFMARDLDRLGTFYHPEVTIYEGGGVNNGWADYRDNHLGPELKELQDLQFSHANRRVHLLEGGRAAYVTSTYAIKGRLGEREIDSAGLETLVVLKDASGSWKIRHSHTSSRPRRQ